MTKFFKSALMLVAALSASFSAFSEPVTEPRKWDFTQGWEHENDVKDCDFWKESTNGRVQFTAAPTVMTELLSNKGTALPGLEGIKFLTGANVWYGITDNFYLQVAGTHYIYIPNVGKGDVINVHYTGVTESALIALTVPSGMSGFAEVSGNNKISGFDSEVDPVKVVVKADCPNLQLTIGGNARLYDITVTPAAPEVEPITTAREWDFANGKEHAEQILCDSWAAGSKGRYGLEVALDDQELPGKDGALSGLEGIYFTAGKSAVYGITQNFCFQGSGSYTVRIPDCGKDDEITVHYAASDKNKAITLKASNTDAPEDGLTESGTDNKTTPATVKVKENGDVTLSFNNSARLYSIKVTPKSTSGIEEIGAEAAEVVATRYYNLMGAPVDASYQGLVIKVETLSNGKIKTTKIAQ